LVEELHADVNQRDLNGYTPLTMPRPRRQRDDSVSRGARRRCEGSEPQGQTVADMATAVSRISRSGDDRPARSWARRTATGVRPASPARAELNEISCYDYSCRTCSHQFEALVRHESIPACPKCRDGSGQHFSSGHQVEYAAARREGGEQRDAGARSELLQAKAHHDD
jgi:hypothetical protein